MKKIRIGTRQSPLALWQANKVAQLLREKNCDVEIIPITSEGDQNLKQPIYSIGLTGVFTKTLDIALLNDQIDLAVHSLKDVPTLLPEGITLKAFPERANSADILVYKSEDIFTKKQRKIATGSLRRRAFWLHKYPNDELVDLRGNVQLRLQKLQANDWDGAIFAFAGLDRAEILDELKSKNLHYKILDWMTPAPSQGILGIACKTDFDFPNINDKNCELFAQIERQFLNILEGGCTAPIGALVEQISENDFTFKGSILSLDGKDLIEIEENFTREQIDNFGKKMAEKCLEKGAKQIIDTIKIEMKK